MKSQLSSCIAFALIGFGCSGEAPPTQEAPPTLVPPVATTPIAQTPEPAVIEAAPVPALVTTDLLHAVPTTVRFSTAFSGNPAQMARLVDGDLTTAWNSQSEDLVGAFIEVRLPADAQVSGIEMTSGYTHQRPNRDLFHGNVRVARVRVMHDGVEVGTYPLSTTSQAMQTLPVTGGGGLYRIELLQFFDGDEPTWREACISELHVLGTAPNQQPGTIAPTLSVVPEEERATIRATILALAAQPSEVALVVPEETAPLVAVAEDLGVEGAEDDEEFADEDEDALPVASVASGSVLTEGEGLRLSELTVAAGVERREAVDPRTQFSKATDARVTCLIRLENPDREATSITVRFEPLDHPERGRDSELNVPASASYTTFTYTGTRGRAGTYRCVVRNAEGALLGSAAWELTE